MKAFKKFWKDFWELQMESNRFMKEHWKGYLVFTAAVTASYFGGLYLWMKAEDKKLRKQIEEVTGEES